MVNADPQHFTYVCDFKQTDLPLNQITTTGDTFLIDLYKGQTECSDESLECLTYVLYIGKAKLTIKFE